MANIDPTPESSIVADDEYVAAAALADRIQRRDARYLLRSALRQVTTLDRLRSCGLPFNNEIVVRRKDGIHHFAGIRRQKEGERHLPGMSTCGSSFVCPVCAAKIRFHRTDEVSRALVSALDQGFGALFVTSTIPHSAEDKLGVTLNLLAEGRRYVANQPVVKALRREAGYLGSITAKEVTYGCNGWHPHTHQVEIYEREITIAVFAALSSVYYDYFSRFYSQQGFDGLSRQHGVRVEHVQLDGVALAHYVAKLQEGTAIRLHTAQELTRSDLKRGRAGAIMPFDIAIAFFQTGDMEVLALWHEYEQATRGKSSIRFTKWLRARLLPNKPKSDDELAKEKVGGTEVARFEPWFYRTLARVPGLEGKVLTALDTGGFAALVELLTVYHLDKPAGYYSLEDALNGLLDESEF